MELLINAFNTILYQPLFNALVLLYQYLPGHDFGIAVVVLTILIKILLYPLGTMAIRSQKNLSDLQPRIREIQTKYKNDKEKQVQATLELYKKEKINPFSGCLPLLIQIPILIALYQIFWRGFQSEHLSSSLYDFVPHISAINPSFLGIMNLAQSTTVKVMENGAEHIVFLWPNIILIILVGITQFIQTKMITSKTLKIKKENSQMDQFSGLMQKQMLYFFPALTVLILWNLPSAIGLYWIVTSLFSIGQQYLVFKKI